MSNPFRALPSVDALASRLENNDAPRPRLIAACRTALDQARDMIRLGEGPPSEAELVAAVARILAEDDRLSLRSVINATGVIVHTNLGRAPLSTEAQQAMIDVARGYSNLEYDLAAGRRGKRDTHVEDLIVEITGAEGALVVNNNAAAVYLALSALAVGREVIISRGQLVEIGGGFRVPDVMRQSNAHLVEVGTTNRTRLADYANAITEQTVALMRIHSSNFRMIGFTEETSLDAMVTLAHERDLIVLDDLGSGTLLDTGLYGLDHEPTVFESITAGADVITFSGDKLLGGPQAGLLVGRRDLIEQLKRHPLARALRPDKLCLAGLAMTLKHYRDGEAIEKIPVWQMITMPLAQLEARARVWTGRLGGKVRDATSTVGGGSLPGNTLPTRAVALQVDAPDQFVARLRQADPPVIGRIQDDLLWLDPRTVLPNQDETLLAIVESALA
ncbi:MAG: L-seryl-tRNA(Sec) selenium transferase [Chloroflexi bacterium]|nr:L-seryl-tRNA(Sec) selenium transferase [Chloroflexota bacterium]